MFRRRIATILIALCAVACLATTLALLLRPANPIVGSVVVGAGGVPAGLLNNWPPVDPQIGRAFLMDDGMNSHLLMQQPGGGYGYMLGNSTRIAVFDTRTGKRVTTIGDSSLDSSLGLDATTHRLFLFDTSFGQVRVLDARNGRQVTSTAFAGGPVADPSLTPVVDAVATDPRSGTLFVVTNVYNAPESRQVLVLDGHTGKTLRTLSFPHGPHSPTGGTYYPSSLSLAIDARVGNIYVFDTNGRMVVLDGATGRIRATHRLPMPIAGASIDERNGHIFAFDVSHDPELQGTSGQSGQQQRPGTLVMLDARTGAVLRRLPGGTTYGYAGDLAVDAETNRAFVANPLDDTIGVLDATSGRVLRSVHLDGAPMQIVLDRPHRRVLVDVLRGTTIDRGKVQEIDVLDAGDGTLRRRITLGQSIKFMAVDAGTGHVMAVATTTSTRRSDPWGWLPGGLRRRLPFVSPPPQALRPGQAIMYDWLLTIDPS